MTAEEMKTAVRPDKNARLSKQHSTPYIPPRNEANIFLGSVVFLKILPINERHR